MDDDVELTRLRERVYGVDGASASPAIIARLAELEADRLRMPRVPATGRSTDASAPPTADAAPEVASGASDDRSRQVPPPPTDSVDSLDLSPAETAPRAHRVLRWALTAVGAIALVGLGIAIGSIMAMPAATADPAPTDPPELAFPQTSEDVVSAEIMRDSGIDAASTRYIATVDDFRIYLARPDDGDGRCIVAFTSSDNRPWSAGCASGAQRGAAVFGIDQNLTVAIGHTIDDEVAGTPLRLSDSVTAYVTP